MGFAAAAQGAAEHPRLFLRAADLPGLREKVKDPAIRPWYEALISHCDRVLKEPPAGPPPSASTSMDRSPGELGLARKAQGRIVTLAFGHLLTGKPEYLDRAWAEIECWTDRWTSWTDPFHGPADFHDLMTGEMGFTMGVAYDWLYPALLPERRAKLRDQLGRRVVDLYLANTGPPKPAWWFRARHNWNAVCNGGAVVAALALGGEHAGSNEVISRAKASWRGFFEAFRTEGGWDEGTGYWQYGTRYGVMALAALRGAGMGDDGELDRPGVRETGNFPVSFCPGGTPVSWGDSGSGVRDPVLYFLGGLARNPDLIRYMDRIRDGYKPHDGGWPVEAFAILWRPVDEPWLPKPGSPLSLPTARVYREIGWSVFVDSWENPSFVAGFKCGDLGANHTQLDNNTFQLRARGEWLAVDLGSGSYDADYFSEKRWAMYPVGLAWHNGLLIGGRGQLPKTKGSLEPIPDGPRHSGVVGDATANYGEGVRRARRHFVVVRKAYVVMLDEVETDKAERIEWRLHTPGPAETADGGAVYRGKAAVLHVILPSDLVAVRCDRAPGDLPPGRHDFVIAASSRAPATSHLIPSVLIPAVLSAPRPSVLMTIQSGRVEVSVNRSGERDALTWEKTGDGWRLSEVH